MAKLTDLQSILLSTAAQRESGSLLPVAETIAHAGDRLTKAIAAPIKRRFAEERETGDPAVAYRADGDLTYGVFITETGLAAIGVSDAGEASDAANSDGPAPPQASPATLPSGPRVTKTSTVLALLERDGGATLAELIAATGWLPHTTRAALTGLRKKSHVVEPSKRDDKTCYQISAVAAVAA